MAAAGTSKTREQERELIDRYRVAFEAGEPIPGDVVTAIDALFARCQGRVYAACWHVTGHDETARDLAQEALLTGYRKLHTFRAESALGTWLYGIARMLCFNAIRRKRELLSEDGVMEVNDGALSVLARLRKEEKEELIRQASQSLDPLEQEAIYLRYVEGIPQERITEILGIEQSSGARGLLQRCRRRLQRELRSRLEELGHGTSFFRESLL